MAVITTLANCNTNPALNGPDGSTDLPSTLDDSIRYALSFIAQLRDGVASGGGLLWMTGMVANFSTATAPTGWLKLNGQLVSRTTYANLFAFATASGLISEATWSAGQSGSFSVGDGSSTFRLPDLRSMFLRGLDEGRGNDPGRVLGMFQDSANLTHNHPASDSGHTHTGGTDGSGSHSHSVNDPGHSHPFGVIPGAGINYAGAGGNPVPSYNDTGAAGTNISINGVGNHTHSFTTNTGFANVTTSASGGTESRPKNVALPFYIKY